MKERLRTFMDELLKDVPKSRKVLELKEELIGNMEERYEDLMGPGIPGGGCLPVRAGFRWGRAGIISGIHGAPGRG